MNLHVFVRYPHGEQELVLYHGTPEEMERVKDAYYRVNKGVSIDFSTPNMLQLSDAPAEVARINHNAPTLRLASSK